MQPHLENYGEDTVALFELIIKLKHTHFGENQVFLVGGHTFS